MSYCRFQNTALDLHECENVLEEMFDGSTGESNAAAEEEK
jgi:hypothetical protein